MTEEDKNKNDQQSQFLNQVGSAQNPGSSFPKKKRRRRPRRKNTSTTEPGLITKTEQFPPAQPPLNSSEGDLIKKKKKRRRRPKNKMPYVEPGIKVEPDIKVEPFTKVTGIAEESHSNEPFEPEPVVEPEPEPELVVEPEPVAEPEPVVEPEPEPELVVEPEPVAEPEPVVEPEPVAEPEPVSSGWADLKEAIKKDHIETQKMIDEKVEQPKEISENKNKVIPEALVEEVKVVPNKAMSDEEIERNEIVAIIKRYVFGGCVIVAIISAVLFFRLPQLVFEGVKGIFGNFGEQTEIVDLPEESSSENSGKDVPTELEATLVAGENKGTSRDKFEEGVETVLISGETVPVYKGVPDSIKVLFLTGVEGSESPYLDRIASYMAILTKLQNAFSTDIHQLLDMSQNRENALNSHLSELRTAYQEAIDARILINEERDKLKIQFNEVTTQKDKFEKDFFVALDKLEGSKSNDVLNLFIELSKRQTELKAHYNALNKTSALFDIAIKNMDARIRDIEFNSMALIQGVKVVDIKGSDLKLIIQESDLM